MSRLTSLHLLDTDVVSTLSRPNPDPQVAEWFARAEPGTLAVSWSTVFELQFGVELARRGGSPHADTFERNLLGVLRNRRFRVLLPTVEAARQRARMFATPELRGFFAAKPDARKPRFGEDLTIAATAMSVGAVIVTMNSKDFLLIAGHFTLPGVLHPATGEWTVQPPSGSAAVPKSLRRSSELFATTHRTHRITAGRQSWIERAPACSEPAKS
ncbi:hypothetical protein [Aureimonas pseudogalii]|uniref:PIN domain-containing protein n=1 Tax=Aureimonas pseudogalii TaxID=1744844 RepID=A0A7W6H4U7_9HYPH|nr:hypothetical protein [Aureimonas pseudogalii]MBB3998359.1 hypothetical protein [Aureimonas pseudogalii]